MTISPGEYNTPCHVYFSIYKSVVDSKVSDLSENAALDGNVLDLSESAT